MIRWIALAALCLVALLPATYLVKGVGLRRLDDAARADLQRHGLAHSFVRLSAGEVHYRLEGPEDGEPVLLIHGFAGPMFVWDGVIPKLTAAGYRVLAFDGYGRGFSDRPDGVYDASLADTQIGELLHRLAIRGKVHVVGYSAGGIAAAVYAGRHPGSVASLSLIAPGGFAPKRPLPAGPFRIPGVQPWFARVVAPGLFQAFFDKTLTGLPQADRFRMLAAQQFRYDGAGRAMTSMALNYPVTGAEPLYVAAAKTGVATSILWGEADTTAPFPWSQSVRRLMPQARFRSVPHAEHNIVYAQPDLVADQLLTSFRDAAR